MKKYLIKSLDSYFTGTFEIGGTIIMTNFSSEKNDAKVFDTKEECEKMLQRINDGRMEIEEV